jgi:alpha-N-arabinofuranosidase
MYVPFQGARLVPVSFDAGSYSYGDIHLPQVDAVGARDTWGRLWLALVNVDPVRPARFSAAIDGAHARSASGEVLTSATVDAHNSFERQRQVAPTPLLARSSGGQLQFELPPKSVAVLQVVE